MTMNYWDRVCALNLKQETKGMGKYGQTLEQNTTLTIDQRIEHLEEEMIDALKYAEHLREALRYDGLPLDDYQRAAMRTASGMDYSGFDDPDKGLLLNGVMGLNGEAGECVDIVKKHLFQGHDFDEDHFAEELGDVLWYVAVAAQSIGYSLSSIARKNIDKLKARYPEGFDKSRSVNRDA